LGIIYIGLESGNDELLKTICKGADSKDMIEAAKKIKASGILNSVIMILGLGGRKLSSVHARDSGKVVSEMDPDYLGALTLMVVNGTEVARQVEAGELELLTPREIFEELKILLENINVSNCVFRANHASNYLTFGGTLPKDKARLIKNLEKILAQEDLTVKDEFFRGL
jgi:radical SAM superfamily enzyme